MRETNRCHSPVHISCQIFAEHLVHADKKTNAHFWREMEGNDQRCPAFLSDDLAEKVATDSALDAAKPESQSTRAVHPLELGT